MINDNNIVVNHNRMTVELSSTELNSPATKLRNIPATLLVKELLANPQFGPPSYFVGPLSVK